VRPRAFVDLFAGIGGFHHGLKNLQLECALAVEIDADCRRVYQASFPELPPDRLLGDIRSITLDPSGAEREPDAIRSRIPEHDVLCAGFPCQPFSKSGAQLGAQDRTRGTLFYDIMAIVRACEPRFVMLENVRNLAGPRHRDTWTTIIEALREAGYAVSDEPLVFSPHLLRKSEGGAPQVRDRVFVLGHRVDGGTWEHRIAQRLAERRPSPGWDPSRWRIADWLDPEASIADLHRYELRPAEQGWIAAWQAFCEEIPSNSLPGFPIWADDFNVRPRIPGACADWKRDFLQKNSAFYQQHRHVIDAWRKHRWGPLRQRLDEFPPSRRKFEWQARTEQRGREDRDLAGLVIHLRPSGIRVKPPTYLPALVAITQTSIVGSKVTGGSWRRITPREASKLQGIPPEVFEEAGVEDATAYRQLGNAVNAGVVGHLAEVLFRAADSPILQGQFAEAV
jgi:DNA (cytosine-5)-methyltransferase 1